MSFPSLLGILILKYPPPVAFYAPSTSWNGKVKIIPDVSVKCPLRWCFTVTIKKEERLCTVYIWIQDCSKILLYLLFYSFICRRVDFKLYFTYNPLFYIPKSIVILFHTILKTKFGVSSDLMIVIIIFKLSYKCILLGYPGRRKIS